MVFGDLSHATPSKKGLAKDGSSELNAIAVSPPNRDCFVLKNGNQDSGGVWRKVGHRSEFVFAENYGGVTRIPSSELQRARDDSGSSQNRCQTLGGLPQVKQNSVITKNEEDFRAASDDRQKQQIASFFPRVDSNGKATT